MAIVGGGITGLAAAYYLEKARRNGASLRYTLLERTPVLGGKIITDQVEGFLLEGGPDGFSTRKPWVVALCRELGLEEDLLGTNDRWCKVYVLSGGRLRALPKGMMSIVPTAILPFAASRLISLRGKLRVGMDLFIPRRKDDGDETLASFVRRRLGGEALAKIAEPLLSGICVSDPERTSLKSSFPWLMDVEREYGSLIRGMRAVRRTTSRSDNGARPKLPMFMSLRGGMRQLVDALAGKLDPDAVCAGREVTDVESLNRHGPPYRLKLRNGAPLEADAMILTTPSDVSSRLLKQFDPTLAEELAAIRYVSTAVVALGYRPHNGLAPLNGFGLVIPKAEHRRIIGCTWSSAKFDHRAPKDHKLVHCFAGGPAYEGMVDLADGVLIQVVREELADIMALRAAPDLVRVYRWVKANPLYDLGHLDRVEAMRRRAAEHGGLFLAGSSFDGAGVPDCVRQGQEAADAILAGLRCIVPQALAYHS